MKTSSIALLHLVTCLAGAITLQAQTPSPAPTVSPTPVPAPDYVTQLRTGATAGPNSANVIAYSTAIRIPAITSLLFGTIGRFAQALWLNPAAAQSTVDSLGEKAAPLFIAYGEFAGPLAIIDPISYAKLPAIPAGYSWTILPPQSDGTWPTGQRSVTINYIAPVATPSPTPVPTP